MRTEASLTHFLSPRQWDVLGDDCLADHAPQYPISCPLWITAASPSTKRPLH